MTLLNNLFFFFETFKSKQFSVNPSENESTSVRYSPSVFVVFMITVCSEYLTDYSKGGAAAVVSI